VLIVATTAQGHGQELIIVDKTRVAREIGGEIDDPSGAPLERATVRLISCASSYRKPKFLVSITSDSKGRFHFPTRPFEKEYCLQISKDGFNSMRLSLRLRKSAPAMKITLPVAA
jgi:hypothetical protein